MKKGWLIVLILFIIIIVGLVALFMLPTPAAQAPTTNATDTPAASTPVNTNNSLADTIVVDTPTRGTTVTSPLSISGKARGSWYFEASAPIALLDSTGATIAQGHITANGNWMTTDFVPFTASLAFPTQPAGSTGTLVLTNDNPSGDPAKQKELDIPVTF